MIAAGERPRKNREFRGPVPQNWGIRFRDPHKVAPDLIVQKSQDKEEKLRWMREVTEMQNNSDLANEWDRQSQRRAMHTNIRNKVAEQLQLNQFSVEERRQKLRAMLLQEQEENAQAMEAAQETVLERQAKMRAKSKALREQREAERLQVVQEKYDQQFREQCEELRSTLSKRDEGLLNAERMEQLKVKEAMKREQKCEDTMYDELWERDRLEKMAREEREAKELFERNQKTLEMLQQQKAAIEAHREKEKELKAEENALMQEQNALRKLEEQANFEEKKRLQQETRDMLDQTLKMKMRKKAIEEQEQLAFDLKMLEQLLEESKNEARETLQRKIELRDEDRRYRAYLKCLMEEEKRKEAELERMIQQEVEAVWQKRIAAVREERRIRKLLLEQVIAGRNKQLQERLLENEKQKAESLLVKQQIAATIEENKRMEEMEAAERQEERYRHQCDLLEQIQFNQGLRDEEERQKCYEYKMGLQAEKEYQAKLKECLDNPVFPKLHPMRKALLRKQAQC